MFERALRIVRQYHRLSQSEMADKIGISRSYLNEIEKGKKEPSLDVLKKYSDAFDLPLSHLMLFAERSDTGKADGIRHFAASKVLKMLEWLADGIEDADADEEANSDRKVSPLRV